MKKNYVLDTNVLLHDPYAIFKFEDNDLILPIYVLEEIDQFKRDNAERGRNARTVSRLLDAQREKYGSLSEGVKTSEGGTLRVYVPTTRPEVKIALRPSSGDHAILQCAVELKAQYPDRPTIFVTMDVNLRIRADAFGLPTQAYENQSVDVEHLDTGVVELLVKADEMDRFFETGVLAASGQANLYANVCVLMRDDSPRQRTGLARFNAEKAEMRALRTPREGLSGIRPRNKEQSFARDLLLDDSIRLVTRVGKAGTGKTLLALAAGLRRTVDDGAYARLLVSRPVMPMGRDLGFLPGDIGEKLNPWMQPIFDNLEFLLAAGGGKRRGARGFEELLGHRLQRRQVHDHEERRADPDVDQDH